MFQKLKFHQIWNAAKTIQKYHQQIYIAKRGISTKLKCHQNLKVTKTEMPKKQKYHHN